MKRLILASLLMAASAGVMAADHSYNCTSEAGDVVNVTESSLGDSFLKLDGEYAKPTQHYKAFSMKGGKVARPFETGYPANYYLIVFDGQNRIEEVANLSTYIRESGSESIPNSWLNKHSGICSTVKERAQQKANLDALIDQQKKQEAAYEKAAREAAQLAAQQAAKEEQSRTW
ncbi:TPA: hypothetical protein ACV5RJ_004338 [Enterobacter roggenkampii]